MAPAGGAGEHLDQQRLLHAGALGRERHRRRDRVHAEHQQHVLHRAADVERLEQEPERGEAEQPAGELDREDLAEVAPAVEQDRQALAHARPERLQPDREDGEAHQGRDRRGR